jgi:hypothetical protein
MAQAKQRFASKPAPNLKGKIIPEFNIKWIYRSSPNGLELVHRTTPKGFSRGSGWPSRGPVQIWRFCNLYGQKLITCIYFRTESIIVPPVGHNTPPQSDLGDPIRVSFIEHKLRLIEVDYQDRLDARLHQYRCLW